MAIVVEDGTGLVTANAYASVAEVDEILGTNIHAKWNLLTDPATKEKLIEWATRILDERVRWFGKKTFPTSGLAWPRIGVRDRENLLIDDNVVPHAVKVATAVLAEHLIAADPEVANASNNLTMMQVDVIILKFDANIIAQKYPPELGFILRDLGWVSFGRGGPKRIIKH